MERRRFLLGLGAIPLAARSRASASQRAIEYRTMPDAIEVWTRQGRTGRLLQRVPSRQPSALITHQERDLLFVTNAVSEHEGLPTGSVESYAVDRQGRLHLLSRQALSLAAVEPNHLTLAPGGQHLIAASSKAKIYNVLPVGQDGILGRVTHALKLLDRPTDLGAVEFADGQLRRQYNQQR